MERVIGAVIAVILGLIALAGVVYEGGQAMTNSKSNALLSDMAALSTNAHSQFMQSNTGYTNFTTTNTPALITAGILPADMNKSGIATDQWGNAMAFSGTNAQFTITVGGANMPQDACTSVVTGMQNYQSMSVNGNTFTPAAPPDAVSAANACTAGASIAVTYN
ncbi:type 4 pilus major pilin [Ferrovum sp.]|uniref:type 4 pilus major pilin n=1 Tax=Ferrovum sp. TaxID=2609467 RepID=UPI0026083776|nr:type 4 pilus major pilin [Ferrovum sp.]